MKKIVKHFTFFPLTLPAYIRYCLVMHLEGGSDPHGVPIKLHSCCRLNGPLMPAMLMEWAGNLD